MKLPAIEGLLHSRSLRAILESKRLAQLGDFLVNFIYSTVKIGIKDSPGGVHVWDSSLRDAMEISNMRKKLGKSTQPGRVADSAEAFIAYSYYTDLISLDEMTEFLSRRLNAEDFEIMTIEKDACATAFGELLQKLAYLAMKENRFDD